MKDQAEKIIYEYELKMARGEMKNIGDVLADEFIEYGSSGTIYTKKDEVMAFKDAKPIKCEIINFDSEYIAENIIQARYVSIHTNKKALRSSIWKLIDNRWQMIFHQGTLLESKF